ncbi:hypothetical protein [Microbacterium testaceum]|uniref:hypothetical protein n=1 Tax=Microbacterium testaceum TaxID=2033 RepID=UPI0022E7EF8B|nr:hypothetical protein [Microbacterium testaceum]
MGQEEVDDRVVRIVDRYARSIKGAEVTVETVMSLFDELGDMDEEHSSISVIDSDEWNLEIYADFVTFENVEELGSSRQINDPTRDELAEIVREFIAGDFESVRSHGWQQ